MLKKEKVINISTKDKVQGPLKRYVTQTVRRPSHLTILNILLQEPYVSMITIIHVYISFHFPFSQGNWVLK
jgi:hypothetical protein